MSNAARRIVLVATALALVALLVWRTHGPRNSLATEPASQDKRPAPDFVLTQLDGQMLRLSEYRGKVILLDFWASWCAPCRDEIPSFVDWQNRYRAQGLQVIGISMDDSAAPARSFYQEFRMNYPVALVDEKLVQSYGGVLGLPVNFIIGRDGRIRAKHLGMASLPALEQEIAAELAKPPQP